MEIIEKRKTVVNIVRNFLTEYYNENKLHELKFEIIDSEVRKYFPNSKFNPFHLAHYKHKFLTSLNDIKMYKGRVRYKTREY